MMAKQDRQLLINQEEGRADRALAMLVGSVRTAELIHKELESLDEMRDRLALMHRRWSLSA